MVPGIARGGLFIALGCLALALQPPLPHASLSVLAWLALGIREALLGLGLGFGLASFLWAFAAAGAIVDAKVGLDFLRTPDAASGAEGGASGALLGRLAACWFMLCGGFGSFVRIVLDSFRFWPVGTWQLQSTQQGVIVFESWFAEGSLRALLLAGPVLVILFAIDLVLGLVNRFAPQIPLLSLSASVKGWAAVVVWCLMLNSLLLGFDEALLDRLRALLPSLSKGWAILG
jgi:type III secretory pathway component EscT